MDIKIIASETGKRSNVSFCTSIHMDYETQPEELKRLLDSGESFTFLDCREHWEYQTAHIEGTIHIPMQDIPARIQELDPDEHIVVICHHGVRSMNVTAWLRQQGFEKAQSVAGGIDRWSRMIDNKVPIY
jgi:rhodanese-related sulfurtransferase